MPSSLTGGPPGDLWVSRITGGKFANGAYTAAFVHVVGRVISGDVFGPEGEWVYPEGMPQDLTYEGYDTVRVNGIVGSVERAQEIATRTQNPVYYNSSGGFLADVLESARQKWFGHMGDPLAARLSSDLSVAQNIRNVIGHSQGALIVSNASRFYGLSAGMNIHFISPAMSSRSARLAATSSGANHQYIMPRFDGANVWAGNVNPVRWATGAVDIFCGFCTHRAQW